MSDEEVGDVQTDRKHEILMFLFLTAILIPGLTILLVGGTVIRKLLDGHMLVD